MDILTIKVKTKMIEIPLVTTPMMTLIELAVCIETFDQTSTQSGNSYIHVGERFVVVGSSVFRGVLWVL